MYFKQCEDFYEVSVKVEQPECDPKNCPDQEFQLLNHWVGDNNLRNQLTDELFQKESVFGGKF